MIVCTCDHCGAAMRDRYGITLVHSKSNDIVWDQPRDDMHFCGYPCASGFFDGTKAAFGYASRIPAKGSKVTP